MTLLRTLRREKKRKHFWNMGTKTHLTQSALSNEPADLDAQTRKIITQRGAETQKDMRSLTGPSRCA